MAMLSDKEIYGDNGHIRSKSLFKELAGPEDFPIFVLSHRKVEGFVNLRSIFIELTQEDPSEFVFAEEVFGDYKVWKHISKCTWMKPHLDEWRETADIKRKSKAFKQIVEEAKEGRSKFTASKYLIEEPWKTGAAKKRSKETTQKSYNYVKEDADRLKEFMQ